MIGKVRAYFRHRANVRAAREAEERRQYQAKVDRLWIDLAQVERFKAKMERRKRR